MWEDPIVAEVHRTREMLAAKFNFEIDAIFADMQKRQAALGARLVRPKSSRTRRCSRPGPPHRFRRVPRFLKRPRRLSFSVELNRWRGGHCTFLCSSTSFDPVYLLKSARSVPLR